MGDAGESGGLIGAAKIRIARQSPMRHLLLNKHRRKDPNYSGYLQTRTPRRMASITFSTLVKFIIFTSLYAKRLLRCSTCEDGTSSWSKEGGFIKPEASSASSKWPKFQSAKLQVYLDGLFVFNRAFTAGGRNKKRPMRWLDDNT